MSKGMQNKQKRQETAKVEKKDGKVRYQVVTKKQGFFAQNKSLVVGISLLVAVALVLCVCLVIKHKDKTYPMYSKSDVEQSIKKLGDYKKLDLTSEPIEVTKENIQAEIDSALESETVKKEVKKGEVKKGDTARIDFVGKMDGKEFTGGSATDFEITIGDGGFIDGFEDGIKGMKIGEEKQLKLKFPKDYPNDEVAGKDVTFDVTVKSIIKNEKPELNDEFVQKVSDKSKTVKEYKQEIKARLTKQMKRSMKMSQESDLLRTTVDKTVLNKKKDSKGKEVNVYPKGAVEKEVEKNLKSYEEYAKEQGQSLEDFIQTSYEKSLKEYKKELRKSAEETVKEDLVISAIAQKEGIKVTREAVDKYKARYLKDMDVTEQEFEQQAGQTLDEYLGDDIYKTVYRDEVSEKLYDIAKANTEKKAKKKSEKKDKADKKESKDKEKNK